MRKPLRCMLSFLLALAPVTAQAPAPSSAAVDAVDARQILWQRSLDDALAQHKATGKPLLIALNMDGESASDRIVYERYRDPAFVALTRRCVCVVASVFRHNARDHDEHGRRIPCPRCGEITCGEHVALEPILFEKYLADGERVAPRHALILADGVKAWDLSLCFDLRDIERALAASLRDLPPPAVEPGVGGDWTALAQRRDARGRAALEAAVLAAPDETALLTALDAIAAHGDASAVDALQGIAAHLPRASAALQTRFVATAKALHVEPAAAAMLIERLQRLGAVPTATDPDGRETLLPLLATLDGKSPTTRTLLLACRAFADYGEPTRQALAVAFTPAECEAIERALATHGGPLSLASVLAETAAVTRSAAPGSFPAPGAAVDELADTAKLEQRLAELDERLKQQRDDAALQAAYAKASLDLGRRRLEAQAKDAQILFDDAELHFARALTLAPAHAEWWLDRARNAYCLARFADEVTFAQRALALALGGAVDQPLPPRIAPAAIDDNRVHEALRWIADGNARQLGSGQLVEPVAQFTAILQAVQAQATIARHARSNANDWTGMASLCGLLGLWREQLAIAFAGAERLPKAPELRQCLNEAAWRRGHIDFAAPLAEALQRAGAATADGAWFAGFARLLQADDRRRSDDMRGALAALERADAQFVHAAALEPSFATTCAQYRAIAWLGRGLAHARLGEHRAAADALLELVATGAPVTTLRDGCDCDAFDLVDRIFEWREQGPSPIDPTQLLTDLEARGVRDPFWATAIADALLREALRADGRNPDRVERDTVDAGGKKIRMPMGRPTEEGDAYLIAARAIARRAIAPPESDRPALAQVHAIWAERLLDRDRVDDAAAALAEAAALLGATPPLVAGDLAAGDLTALRAAAAPLRAQLGAPRPRERQGR